MRKLVTGKNVCKPAKNKSIFLVKVIVFRQLMMTDDTTEMFWMPRSTDCCHTFLQMLSAKIINVAIHLFFSQVLA